jgi:hypothetical protein
MQVFYEYRLQKNMDNYNKVLGPKYKNLKQ